MEKIKSFTIDHTTHEIGFYKSNLSHGIYTYDLRFKKPNNGNYLSNAAMHTIEHIFATVIRNSSIKDKVVYFGPMGCRTGFYLLLLGIDAEQARSITIKCMEKCLEFTDIPGSDISECGNYLEHSLEDALCEIKTYLLKLKGE